jgi:DNA-binding NarL/FixJ family response regulator
VADVARDAVARGTAGGDGAGVFGRLTPRERQVLQLVSEGKATKQAARCLNLSVKTIETHRRSLMEKLDLHSVAELTKYAIREGLTTAQA